MSHNDLQTIIASVTKLVLASVQQDTIAQAPAPAPVVAPEAASKPERCYPTLDALRALGYAVPEGATMAVLTSTGKVWYYAVLPSGARESYESYHKPTARECKALRAQFAQA